MLVNCERATELMEREGLDALIAVTPNNVLYLSDFDTDFLYDVPWVACAILPHDPDIPPCLVATEIEAAVLVQGGRPFATFNGAGPMSAGAGRPERDYVIRPGDQVCFDSMMKWRRYMGDCQRTAVLGEPSAKLARYW